MKYTKLISCLILGSVLIGSPLHVKAADTPVGEIVVDGTGTSYAAYRLFDVNAFPKDDGTVTYNYNVNSVYDTELKTVAKAVKPSIDSNNDSSISNKELVDGLEGLNAVEMRTFADEIYTLLKSKTPDLTTNTKVFESAPFGYYLIVQTGDIPEGSSRSAVLLSTVGAVDGVTVSTKEGVPTLTKKILVADATAEGGYRKVDATDVNKGDTILYEVSITVPESIKDRRSFSMTIHDKGDGIKMLSEPKFFVNSKEATLTSGTGTATDGCLCHHTVSQSVSPTDNTLTSNLTDKTSNKSIILSPSDIITVRYSGSLSDDYKLGNEGNINEAWLEFTSDPYDPTITEETPHDKVIAFTYQLLVNKVDKEGAPLDGATFTLFQKAPDGTWREITSTGGIGEVSNTSNTFNFKGLDAGDYKLVETKVPDGYQGVDDIFFTIKADYAETGENPSVTSLTVLIDGKVVSTGDDATFSVDIPSGGVSTNVVNIQGIKLPSTGELGMMLLLVGGVVLIIVGGVILTVTKKYTNHA